MEHWYNWLALVVVVGAAFRDGRTLVVNAWRSANGKLQRKDRGAPEIFWISLWITAAIALLVT